VASFATRKGFVVAEINKGSGKPFVIWSVAYAMESCREGGFSVGAEGEMRLAETCVGYEWVLFRVLIGYSCILSTEGSSCGQCCTNPLVDSIGAATVTGAAKHVIRE
jgi:hypothetical protein